VRVAGMDITAARMAHEGLSNVGNNAGFHQACVEGVPEIVKPQAADAGAFQRLPPGGFHQVDWLVVIGEDIAFRLMSASQEFIDAVGEGNLARFAADSLGFRDQEQLAVKIDIFPSLVQQFSTPHACIQRRHDDRLEMLGARSEQLRLFAHAEDPRLGSPFRH
jgi:hypothetical protein